MVLSSPRLNTNFRSVFALRAFAHIRLPDASSLSFSQTIIILPTACYVAIAVASLIFIFPETLSHQWINSVVTSFLEPSISLLTLQEDLLSSLFPLESASFTEKVEKGKAMRRGIVAGVQGIHAGIG